MHNSVVFQTMWEFTVSMIGLWRKSAVYPQIGRQKQKIANLSTVQRIIFDVFHRKRDIHNGAIKKNSVGIYSIYDRAAERKCSLSTKKEGENKI